MVTWKLDLYKADANACYKEIKTLENITPENVLELAKDTDSELHKCFTWNNDQAAEKWRLHEARNVIQLLVVTSEEENTQPKRVFEISSKKNEYKPISYFMQNKDEYTSLLDRAVGELKALENRYKSLAELEKVFEAIDEL